MATPVGHMIAGVAASLGRQGLLPPINWKVILGVFVLANLPDIDFLFGAVVGNPNRFHHGWTHSIAFAVLTGVTVGVIVQLQRKNGIKAGLWASGILGTHLVLDYISKDTRVPYGMPLFWPFSDAQYLSPVIILQDVHKASGNDAFFASLICWHNLVTIFIEVAVLSPLILLVYLHYRKHKTVPGAIR